MWVNSTALRGTITCDNMLSLRVRKEAGLMRKIAALLLVVFMTLAAGFAQAPPAGATGSAAVTAEYNAMVDQYFDAYFHFHPSDGTAARLSPIRQRARRPVAARARRGAFVPAGSQAGRRLLPHRPPERRAAHRLEAALQRHQCAPARAAGNPHVAEGPQRLLRQRDFQHLWPDEPEVCAPGRAPEVGDCARTEDPRQSCGRAK